MKPGAPRVQKAADSNVRTEREVVYPFGVQNDLGHVVLTRNAKTGEEYLSFKPTFEIQGPATKSSREDGRGDGCPGPPITEHPLPPQHPQQHQPHPPSFTSTSASPLASSSAACMTTITTAANSTGGVKQLKSVSPPPPLPLSPCLPPAPPEPELLSPRVLTASVSHLSLQSSRHNRFHSGNYSFHRLASSLSDLSYDVAVLERAIRTNDVTRVKKCFEKHRHRFQLLERAQNSANGDGETGGGSTSAPGGPPVPGPSQRSSRPSEITTAGDLEENPVVFTNALHLAVEWGANDVLRFLLREQVDPNKGGRLPDAYDISVAGSRSASVSAWGSGCVFCPPSPKNISRDVSPSREIGRIFSRNSSRNVSSESSRCVSPCRDRPWSAKPEVVENRNAYLRREAFKNLTSKNDDKTESSNGDHDLNFGPPPSSEVRPIISVVYCTSDERRRSSSARPSAAEIVLPGSGFPSEREGEVGGEWTPVGQQRRMNRRVSWVSSLREPADRSRMTLAGRLRRHSKLRLPRQRSFSLESELELRTVAKRAVGVAGALASIREARRSISLKSSPLHFPWNFRRESSSAMRESGVFAELRRSSEIFRNILLSIAGRDESTPTDEDQCDLDGKDLSFSSLLAAHGRRRSERSVSYSSCSWSDVSIGSETLTRKPLSINPAISKGLLVVSIEPRGREVTFVEHYSSAQLMTLPPLFLAACRGRSTPVTLLLQHGAKPGFMDSLGNTPLHLAVVQMPTPWDPILDLMEAGGKILIRNARGVSPVDLLPPIARLQKQLVADCWLGLVLEDAAHITEHPEQGVREPGSRSSRLFKKLHEARHHKDKNNEARTTAQKSGGTGKGGGPAGDQGQGNEFSATNEVSTPLTTPCPILRGNKTGEENNSNTAGGGIESKKKLKRRKDKTNLKTQTEADPVKMEWSELARCLLTLKSIATNDECLDDVLIGLVSHTQSLLKRFQQVPPTTDVPLDPHKCLSGLLHTLILVAVQCHGSKDEPKKYLSDVMCTLAQACLLLATGPHPLQYTAMVAMNKVVDVAIVHRLTKERIYTPGSEKLVLSPDLFVHSSREIEGEKPVSSSHQAQSSAGAVPTGRGSLISSKIGTSGGKGPFQKSKSKEAQPKQPCVTSPGQDFLGVLEPAVGPIVNILHNAVTLYKRTIGSRQICTPSVRRRTCSAHCLQLLSARILVFLVHAAAVQKSLVSEAPLRILIAALDATHDPQLLCLVLQILATLALDPAHHKPLIDAGVADALPPLLLPADEFFYTNHTTLFARYVKHHAARLLVYLGLHHRSALRISVFDLITAEESTVTSGTLGNEDLFITWTCSTPPPVLGHPSAGSGGLPPIIAMSVESTLIRVLKSLEMESTKPSKDFFIKQGGCPPGSPYLRDPSSSWINPSPSRNCFSPVLHFRRHSAESRRDSIGGPEMDPGFVRIFQACYPCIVHPTILFRLLLHRLLSTGLALRRWKSCASRASFASAYSGHSGHSVFSMFSGDSRTSRSRASSTDESVPLTLRRRRQVSLTVDCNSGTGGPEGEDSLVLHELEEKASPTEPHQISPTKKINTIRGIFSKWRSSSQEASVDKGEETQRLVVEGKPRESSIFGLLPLAALRAAASRENLDEGGSGPNSQANSPSGSPSFLSKQSFRFGSLHHKKSRRLSRNRSLDVATEVTSPKDTPEDEILAFQRKLQNLPDFLDSSVEPPSPPAIPPASPRPRSRSVPKVTLEAPLPLILSGTSTSSSPPTSPNLPLPTASHLLSPSSPVRGFPTSLPQPISNSNPPPSPGLLTPHSPKATPRGGSPFDDKASTGANVNDTSRRSSVSPASSVGRRQDSIFISDMPMMHRAVLTFVEDWITSVRPQGKSSIIRELKDFVTRVSSCGPPYLRWSDHIRILCPALAAEDDSQEAESLEAIENEYWEMQKLVVSGSLPCSKEEAAVLAGIQLRLEECWPRARPPRIQMVPVPSPSPATPSLNTTDRNRLNCDEKESSLAGESPGKSGQVSGDGSGGCGSDEPPFSHPPPLPPEEPVVVKKSSGMGRAVSLLTNCYSSSDENEMSLSASTRIEDLVPPCYIHAGNMHRLIKEQKRKLFHTSVYESATQLQKLYGQTCRRLPSYGCRLVVVKELLRGKTKKKATRLLGIGPEKIILLDCRTRILARSQVTSDLIQWRAGGGRNHDRLILEFRGTRWSLLVPPVGSGSGCGVSCGHLGTVGGLREAGRALWALLRDMDSSFLQDFTFPRKELLTETDSSKRKWKVGPAASSPELDQLEKVLLFPEEVALALAETESQLFCQVAPLEYLRHVTMELGNSELSPKSDPSSSNQVGLSALIDRFSEISSWVTHLLVSPPTHEERKAILSCLLRVAKTAWNIGAFGSAVEIIAGLKSQKLKPFWLSLNEKEDSIATLEILSKALLGETASDTSEKESPGSIAWTAPEYESALGRALKISTCPVVPFFGAYLRELRSIISTSSLVVLSTGSEHQQLQCLSDPDGEDEYFTRIGPGGLLNMNKLRKVQAVLEKIATVHQHHTKRQQRVAFLHSDRLSIHTSSIERSGFPDDDDSQDSEDDLYSGKSELTDEVVGSSNIYKPVQSISHDPSVSFIPLNGAKNSIDLHILQVLHHGSTALHIDADGRSSFVWVKLERSCGTLTWSKPVWSSLKFSHAQPDFLLSVDPELIPIVPGLLLKYGGGYGSGGSGTGSGGPVGAGGLPDVGNNGLEEGYIDLNGIKEVESGSKDTDISPAMKRYGIEHWNVSETCISLVFGMVLSDNRSTFFVFPARLASIWLTGLRSVVKSFRRVLGKPDRRLVWLKEQYLQLYFEDGKCRAPTMADAIRVFGGRRWSSAAPQGVAPETPPFRRTASAKFRKKRSLANIHMIKESFIRGSDHGPAEVYRPPSPASKGKGESGDGSGQTTPSHQPQSLTRIRSAASVLPSSSGGEPSVYSNSRGSALTHETRLTFQNFVQLFQAFSIRSRKDLRDLFDSIATSQKPEGCGDASQPESPERSHSSSASGATPRHGPKSNLLAGGDKHESKFIYDYVASASIVQNGAGVETSRSRLLSAPSFANFLKSQQGERKTEAEIVALIEKYEFDPNLRTQQSISFEGFARYMMSGNNLAFVNERVVPQEEELDHPLAHYYVGASHNTYLTGHQLKGESSVELYSQVLLTGCRCVELDCWDGDDGDPVIYHGHTFTTKIPFRQVVDAINKSAFLASSYPVILSIENHCSLQQQARMAWTFQTVFGDKLISRFLFDVDFSDDPCLPSPAQLKNRVLIKNKKLHAEIIPNPPIHSSVYAAQSSVNPPPRNRSGSRPQSARTDSIISNVSGGSINDDYSDSDSDYEDEIQDERLVVSRQTSEQALPITPRTDSLTSQESAVKCLKKGASTAPVISSQYQSDQGEWIVELEESNQKKKQSSQIARELSDLVIYIQAIKFRGLTTLSPSSSVRNKLMQRKNILPPTISNQATSLPVTPTCSSTSAPPDHHHRRVISNHPVYQCCSLNENASKKLCRKQPLQVLAHTETQMIRAYPAGMRIDSSNFNPLIFWAFGVQMVALNYQTEDMALHLNASMFEQNGRCGYVLKPAVMWDRNHVMYRRFNPLEKEFDGLHTVHLHLTIISGQFLSPGNYQCSPQVEVEVSGIPVDCAKQKTRIMLRNALNPIWNETITFTIQFRDLAFLRFSVLEGGTSGSGSGHAIAQRVIPFKAMKSGYRHIRLRNAHNQPLPVSTLFVHSRVEEEGEEIQDGIKSFSKEDSLRESTPITEGTSFTGPTLAKPSVALKRRMFFLVVYGVVPEEPYTVLKVTQDTNAADVISSALQKSGRTAETCREYVLIEEVARGWDAKEKDLPPTQRVLDPQEKPLQAQGQWKGEGKFILKRTGNDPSSRAWLSSIACRGRGTGEGHDNRDDDLHNWGEDENFLVCVHNVSPEIPYAILKVPIRSTSQDIITQAFVKARRLEDPTKFVLVEELEPMLPSTSAGTSSDSAGSFRKKAMQRSTNRILEDDENVYEVQLKWNTVGRFILRERKQAHSLCGTSSGSSTQSQQTSGEKAKHGKGLKVSTLARLTRFRSNRNGNGKSREKARQYLTERHALSLHDSTAQATRPRKVRSRRSAHSEGETLSEDEPPDTDFKSTVARLKKVSLRKLRVWK